MVFESNGAAFDSNGVLAQWPVRSAAGTGAGNFLYPVTSATAPNTNSVVC